MTPNGGTQGPKMDACWGLETWSLGLRGFLLIYLLTTVTAVYDLSFSTPPPSISFAPTSRASSRNPALCRGAGMAWVNSIKWSSQLDARQGYYYRGHPHLTHCRLLCFISTILSHSTVTAANECRPSYQPSHTDLADAITFHKLIPPD